MLKNKVVLITGVSKGIGLSCMELWLKNNAYVIGVSRSKIFLNLKDKFKNKFKIIYGDIKKKYSKKNI